VKIVTVRMMTGTNRTSSPRAQAEKAAYEIAKLSDLFGIVRTPA
jgi:hypothetical protein